ncbi:MAG: vWA domain-containing protein [Candidatus Kapaibacteriota bacterium]
MPVQAGTITAGEWSDLANWSFWQRLFASWQYIVQPWQIQPAERVVVEVLNEQNLALPNIVISLKDSLGVATLAQARSDNSGMVFLFPTMLGVPTRIGSVNTVRIVAEVNGQSIDVGMAEVNSTQPTRIKLPIARTVSRTLDVMFVVDATGSMGDEIQYLKVELQDVLRRAQQQSGMTQLRMASVFYRDYGDDYVVRPFPFTTDINSLVNFIGQQDASGGGDFPEAVDEALVEAVTKQQWSGSAVNRLLFLILDAPPRLNSSVVERLQRVMRQAAVQGIRIIPITASGINRETEALMRSLAIGTGGTYIFITDNSGVGNDHLEATVGRYDVEFLNNLILRLLLKYTVIP